MCRKLFGVQGWVLPSVRARSSARGFNPLRRSCPRPLHQATAGWSENKDLRLLTKLTHSYPKAIYCHPGQDERLSWKFSESSKMIYHCRFSDTPLPHITLSTHEGNGPSAACSMTPDVTYVPKEPPILILLPSADWLPVRFIWLWKASQSVAGPNRGNQKLFRTAALTEFTLLSPW